MILVVGATGSLGGRVTRGLLAQGQKVRVLSRNNPLSAELARQGRANSVESLVEAGAEAIYADLKDRDSVDMAVADIDTVITTATATQRGGDDTITAVDLQGTLNLIEAAQAVGVKHFIYTSAFGAAINHLAPLFHIKGTCEAALEASGLAYTILQPTIFMEVWIGMVVGLPLMNQQPITLIGQGDHRHNFVSEADVAALGLAAVNHPQAVNQRIAIGGPDSYTWTQIVATAGKVMGADLPVQYLSFGSEIPLLPPSVGEIMNGMETYESFVDMTTIAPTYGVKLTTLEEYLQQTFAR